MDNKMRLAEFILAHVEPILAEWETFARSIWPRDESDPEELRNHAAEILRATALDMQAEQSASQQSDKSKGKGSTSQYSERMDSASVVHATARLKSGLDLLALIAEYRALRASVIRLWRESNPDPDQHDLADITRFNESIDQSLTEAIRSYTEQIDRSRRMFLAILGHDLRNPLNATRLSADMLAQMCDLDAECVDLTTQISRSTAVMSRMVADLLDFTATSLGAAMPLEPVEMDLTPLCQESIDEMRASKPDRPVHFESPGQVHGQWDRARLRQVVSNLLVNAVQHSESDAPVTLMLATAGQQVELTVHNGGAPIPRDAMPTLFDPLVRGDAPASARQRQAGSVGLGLYIAREIVTAHGGQINVTSSEEDGTRFTVRLPRQR